VNRAALAGLLLAFCCGLGLAVTPAQAEDVAGCGNLANAFGPFDYRDPENRGEQLYLVEMAHFTEKVESLAGGNTGTVIGDIDYTLRAFPNHHRALGSVARYALRGAKVWANPYVQSADCYFLRAVAFAPDDELVRVLFANYLAKTGQSDKARREYEVALNLAPENPEICYNAALFFLDVGETSRAQQLANIAYSSGYPLPGLRSRLSEKGIKLPE
jgi:tetratricopeptide (TPR) repeat protein